jgi:uncharacterized membrane protein YciS (DUF1049 family)
MVDSRRSTYRSDSGRELIGYFLLGLIVVGVCVALAASAGAGIAYDLRYWFDWTPFTFLQAAAIGAVGGAVIWSPAAFLLPVMFSSSEGSGGGFVVNLIVALGVLSLPLVGAVGSAILGLDVATATAVFSIVPVAMLGTVLAVGLLVGAAIGIIYWMNQKPSVSSFEMRDTYRHTPQLRQETRSNFNSDYSWEKQSYPYRYEPSNQGRNRFPTVN